MPTKATTTTTYEGLNVSSTMKMHEQHHLDDEHLLAAIAVGEAAERGGANQDPEQRGSGDHSSLGRPQAELLRHERGEPPPS